MKKVIILSMLVFLVGCQNLIKKQVRIVSNGNGGKVTTVDVVGSGTPTPQVICGNFTSIITTVPPNTIGFFKTTTYQFWSDKEAVEDIMYIDTTSDPIEIRKERLKKAMEKIKEK